MHVLIVHPPHSPLPAGTAELIRSIGWRVTPAYSLSDAAVALRDRSIDVAILSGPEGEAEGGAEPSRLGALLNIVERQRVATLVLSDEPRRHGRYSMVESVPRSISLPELSGRLAMIERYHRLFKLMDRELADMQRLGERLKRHFRDLDQELRLAGRLQRDFLPDLTQPVAGVPFACVFRPASWVSGDLYDVFVVNDDLIGFYVVDAVGHGLSAGLLTMYIKRALHHIAPIGGQRQVLTPSEALSALNESILHQRLPNFQFVTACYGLLNRRTLVLEHARAGSPYPTVLCHSGEVRTLESAGGLLGILPEESYETQTTQLQRSDRVFFHTDGLELAFDPGPALDASLMPADIVREHLVRLASRPLAVMLLDLEEELDQRIGSLHPPDDVTVLALEAPAHPAGPTLSE